jgi:hypothetical protein
MRSEGGLRSGIILQGERLYSRRLMKEQTLDQQSPALDASDLLDPYEKLITIEILGKQVQVPEKNRLLRCFQYLSINSISYGDFCWNGECTNCQIWYHESGETDASDKPILSCRSEVSEGMVITRLSQFIKLEGIGK